MVKHDSLDTFGNIKGFAGLKSKKDENEGWGGSSALDWEAPDDRPKGLLSKNTGNFGTAYGGGRDSALGNRDDGRASEGSNYTGFGLLGRSKTSAGKKKDDEDDIDDILGDIEIKKGIENTKQTSDLRNNQLSLNKNKSEAFSNSKQKFKSSNVDAWGRDNFNDLDDIEETKSNKLSANKNIMDKKRAIFGLGGGDTGTVTPTE